MSDLIPSLIELNKGLDLQSPKLTAEAGSLLDALNYEQVDFQGQKRIDGFSRYDGRTLAAIDEYYVLTLAEPFTGSVSELVAVDDGLLGVVLFVSGTEIHIALINENLLPDVGDSVFVIQSDGTYAEESVVSTVQTGTESSVDADTHYDNLLAYNAILRTPVESLPGGVAGLHWFRDRLYAVADVTAVSLDGTTPTIYPNDILSITGDEDVKVLDAFTRDNTRLLFVASMNPDLWQVEGTDVTRDAVSVGTIANGFETVELAEEVASFFESRSEQQTLDEDGPSGPYDFGWRFVDLGWRVNFNEGISLFGSLPSLNQNIQDVGIQGPTSIAGNNGRPITLVQNIDITNGTEQVNGWKSTNTPTSYDLDADDVTTEDTDFVYADAFVSWDSSTGEINMSGATSGTIAEYPATATVEIEL